MKRKIVYCEMSFLLSFLKNRPIDDDFDDHRDDCWKGLGRFLKRSDLVVNVTKEDFIQKCECSTDNADEDRVITFLKSVIKKSADGEIDLSFKDKFLDLYTISGQDLGDSELNAVFLTDSEKSFCQEKSREYGVIVLNKEGLYNSIHLFKDSGIAFPNRTAKKWNFLNSLNQNLPQLNNNNSILIADNFIFSDSKDGFDVIISPYQDKIEYNLKPIFKSLLPEYLAEGLKFEISVFSDIDNWNLENAYNYIYSIIRRLRPRLRFSLTLYNHVKKYFHDRSIVTNSVWIGCPGGFDVFDSQGNIRKPTNVTITFPLFSKDINWANDTFLNFIKSAKKVIQRNPIPGKNIWGNEERKNRIVSYFTADEVTEVTRGIQQIRTRNRPMADRFSREYAWGK